MAFPKFVKVRQQFQGTVETNIEGKVAEQLAPLGESVRPGMRIGITAGSRGIANIARILKAAVAELRRYGAEPFIFPAMGSHGGATAAGQVEVLESFGVTEAYCGAPIVSSMETVKLGETAAGFPVYMDKHASEADGVLIVARIKVHTDFKSPIGIESGLMKMAAIGMGKHTQALNLHKYGVHGIRDIMPEVAEVVLAKGGVIGGLGIIENAMEQTAKIEFVETRRIPEREKELLRESAALMPSLPVEQLDVLVVDEIGKNVSGTGMDTNIIGRMRILGVDEPASPNIKYIIARDLTEASHGNALGIGLADITTRKLFDKIDFKVMNENVITSTFLHRAMIPIVLENDREALRAAFRGLWGVAEERSRIVRIRSTLHLEHLYVSEAVFEEIRGMPTITAESGPEELQFDASGELAPF